MTSDAFRGHVGKTLNVRIVYGNRKSSIFFELTYTAADFHPYHILENMQQNIHSTMLIELETFMVNGPWNQII